MANEFQATKVITGKVRFSYVHVFEPHSVEEGGAKKYSISILIDKKDKDTLTKIEKAVQAAIDAGRTKLGIKEGQALPKTFKLPLRDGDEERPEDEAYEGMMFLNATSRTMPGLVDANRDAIMQQDEFYSGCYGRVSVNFYAFNTSGNKGIACGLNNIQKLEDGESLGGRVTAEADFGEVDDLM